MRQEGDWEAWVAFFLDGVRETADGAVTTARRLVTLFDQDRAVLRTKGKAAGSALRVHEALRRRPLTSLQDVASWTGLSFPAVATATALLESLKIVHEITGKKRNRVYVYSKYIEILGEGTEPVTRPGGSRQQPSPRR